MESTGEKRQREEGVINFNTVDDTEYKKLKNDSYEALKLSLARINPGKIDPLTDNLSFMQVDVDYYTAEPPVDFINRSAFYNKLQNPNRNAKYSEVPILRVYGTMANGSSMMWHVHGFFPYLYCEAPPGNNPPDAERVHKHFESLCKNTNANIENNILQVELVKKESLMGYNPEGAQYFYKITVAIPSLVNKCRKEIESGIRIDGHFFPNVSYESNIPFALRFTIDNDIVGGNWLEVPAKKYFLRQGDRKKSCCNVELDVYYSDIISHAPEKEYMAIAPIRFLSFDIECIKLNGRGFPAANEDPIIQIAMIMETYSRDNEDESEGKEFNPGDENDMNDDDDDDGDVDVGAEVVGATSSSFLCKKGQKRIILTLDTCASIPGVNVISFQDERQLLVAFNELVRVIDADMLLGYNIINFDLAYILDRCVALKLEGSDCYSYGRILKHVTTKKNSIFQSRGLGKHETKEINIEGRVQFDMYVAIQRDYKLKSYSLNNVSTHFLGEQKEDVHYSIMSELQNGNESSRRRIATYCIKDAILPLRLFHKLMYIYNYIELARVTGVPVSYMLTRGQQIRVISKLYEKVRKTSNFVVPVLNKQVTEEKYSGATVLEPKKGYYDIPIATLDFASLYPSIMIAHNLCYSTLICNPNDSVFSKMQKDVDYEVSPTSDRFIKSSVRKGLLPLVLEDLLLCRKNAKKEMNNATDEFTKQVLNGRQLALKITANSVYGTTGAQVGMLACLPISSSVTGYGRQMIEKTKALVLEKYTKANGYDHDADVIYGDTDSVMVNFGENDIKKAMELGREAADYISQFFCRPIKLEFEKVYFPFLLMNKKRYAALMWTNEHNYDKLDCKGIETVRRDNCVLVQQTVDKCLRLLMIHKDVEGAVSYAKKIISELLQNKIDISLLVITKSLGISASNEGYKVKQAHVELAQKMKARNANNAPSVGDRIPYVIIQGNKNAPAYDRSEEPLYVVENNIAIDANYYLENQLKKPLCRIFEGVLAKPESALFAGEHTKNVAASQISGNSAMNKFVVKTTVCQGCKKVLKDVNAVFCEGCYQDPAKISSIVKENVKKMREKETEYNKLWSNCQTCQGSLHDDILCTSNDCAIFYRRIKVRNQFLQLQNHFAKFNLDW